MNQTFIAPSQTQELEDSALAAVMQQMVVGVTGLSPTLVFPRWQTVPPTRPSQNTNWAAVGVVDIDPVDQDNYAKFKEVKDASGKVIGTYMTYSTWWRVVVLTSFYGPNVGYYSALLADGIRVPQNLEVLGSYGIKFHHITDVTKTAELVNTQWYGRADVTIHFRRQIDRNYPIEALVAAPIEFVTQDGLKNTFTITLP